MSARQYIISGHVVWLTISKRYLCCYGDFYNYNNFEVFGHTVDLLNHDIDYGLLPSMNRTPEPNLDDFKKKINCKAQGFNISDLSYLGHNHIKFSSP